jgi:hypothetical protein
MLRQFLTNEQLQFIGKRLFYVALICLLYFIIWRPSRIAVTEHFIAPQVSSFDNSGDAFAASMEEGALLITYSYSNRIKELQYRPQFGLFFLLTLLALLFVSQDLRHYLLLGGMHLGASLLTYLFLILGAVGVTAGFILTDVISGYLTPALTLAIVPLVIRGLLE